MWWLRDRWSAFKIWRLERQLFHLFEIRLREIYHEAGEAALNKAVNGPTRTDSNSVTITNITTGSYVMSDNVEWTFTSTH